METKPEELMEKSEEVVALKENEDTPCQICDNEELSSEAVETKLEEVMDDLEEITDAEEAENMPYQIRDEEKPSYEKVEITLRELVENLKESISAEEKEEKKSVQCKVCNDEGYIYDTVDGVEYVRECDCVIRARNTQKVLREMKKSGLENILPKMTFKNWQRKTEAQRAIYNMAIDNLNKEEWFFVGGKSGTGKTHIATAMCGQLIKQGKAVRYMQWRRDVPELKSKIKEFEEYDNVLRTYLNADILYIDDLFKGNITDADINLAFTIIDSRYKQAKKTIVTTELTLAEVMAIDEAIGSRIFEKCTRKNIIEIKNLGNYREKLG